MSQTANRKSTKVAFNLYGPITKTEFSWIDKQAFVKSKVKSAWLYHDSKMYPTYIIGYLTTAELIDPPQTLLLRIGSLLTHLMDNEVRIGIHRENSNQLWLYGKVVAFHVESGNDIGLLEVLIHDKK